VSVLLDTTVLIDLLRGRPQTIERLIGLRRRGTVPFTTPINVEEIHRGLRRGELDAATRLFEGLRMAPLGHAEGARAGDWRRELATSGVTLAQADCLIAAAAVSIGVPLATGNPRHFPMAELTVEHWPVGE
jgi:predicted nucleic acid-binding protein